MLSVEAHQLSYSYGDYKAVDDVTFALRSGEFTMLIGRNGSGKSTLLRCIAGWLESQKGQVQLFGKSLQSMRGSLGDTLVFVPDAPPAYFGLTVWEHLQLVGQVNRISNWKLSANRLLEKFALDSHRRAMPAALSRGQRYKLALCSAFLLDAHILMLDEPFGPLDPLSVHDLWQDLMQMRDAGKTVLISNHHASSTMVPDHYLVLDGGCLIADGSPLELQQEYQSISPELDDLLRATLATDRT